MAAPSLSTAGCVTTSHGAGRAVVERARAVAAACGLPLVRREAVQPGQAVLVLESAGARVELGERSVRSHPGMGLVRVRRLVRGEEHDPIVDIAEIQPGDAILDATFGFGQDALVLAWAAGESGRLEGLESSPLLAGLALAGLPFWPRPAPEIASRMKVTCTDARAWMRAAPTGSFDVVFIDPMFRRPRMAAPDFAALRLLADEEPLSVEDLAQARRVARRWVVVKDGWPGADLKRLSIPLVPFRRSAEIVFGRIPGGASVGDGPLPDAVAAPHGNG